MHSLSTVDIRLIALTHTLETAAYGNGHLRDLPAAPRPQSRRPRVNSRQLPGWDAQGGEWEELDKLAEEEEEAAEAARRAGGGGAIVGAYSACYRRVSGDYNPVINIGRGREEKPKMWGLEEMTGEMYEAALTCSVSTPGYLAYLAYLAVEHQGSKCQGPRVVSVPHNLTPKN